MKHKPHTTMGIISLILGIVSILIMITVIIYYFAIYGGICFSWRYNLISLQYLAGIPGAIIAVILGYLAKKQGDSYGLIGLIMGAIVLILVIILIITSAMIHAYASSMPPGLS